MKKDQRFQTKAEKEFNGVFRRLAIRHNAWDVWRDLVRLFACAIALPFEENEARLNEHGTVIQAINRAYTCEEGELFVELTKMTVSALEENPEQDFLGELYMHMDFGSSWHGQFFTPWPIASFMAEIAILDCEVQVKKSGFFTINDPACGAGCMLLAAAAAYRHGEDGKERNFQTDAFFAGQDLDPIVALMCYIQLSLLGCAGYVAIGNSLTDPVCGPILDPIIGGDGQLCSQLPNQTRKSKVALIPSFPEVDSTWRYRVRRRATASAV